MSLGHSPSVVTNGLVMYYDMNNTRKSWLGKPTTNYVIGPNWLGSTLSYNYTGPSGDATYTYVTGVTNPIDAPGVMRYYTGPATAYRYWALRGTVPSAGTYTFSYYARVILGGPSNIGNGQLWRDTGTDLSVTGDFNPTFTTEWKRYSTTGTVTSYLDYFPVHSGAILGGFTIEYCGFQLEAGSFATPFVDGARSTTQAIVDLTNNNTITATSLTYVSDNTFSFNGSSDYITVADSTILTNTFTLTISVWFKSSAAAGTMQPLVGKGTSDADEEYCLLAGGGSIYFDVGAGAGPYTQPSYSFSNNTWYNVVGVHIRTAGSSVLTVYVNGVALSSSTITPSNTPNDNLYPVSIGKRFYNSGTPANGSIPAVSIYNRALSAAEVAQNFNALRGRYSL